MPLAGRTTFTRIRLKGGTGSYILAPVLTTTQRDALTAAEGMVIFNSTTDQLEEYDGATWQAIGQVILDTHIADLDAHTKDRFEVLRTGEYHFGIPFYSTTGQALSANYIYASLFIVARDMTVDRVAVNVSAAGSSGKKAYLGIYNVGTNLYPGTLLLDAGTVDIDGTGVQAITINQSLPKGIYFVAILPEDGVSIKVVYPSSTHLGVSATDLLTYRGNWSLAQAYGALPATFPSDGEALGSKIMGIALRLASLD